MKRPLVDHLHAATLRIAKFHFIYVALFVIQSIIFHASKVITPELLLKRWVAVAGLATVTLILWFSARTKLASLSVYRGLIGIMVIADIAFAAFNVYTQRGYASKSVFLFLIPIIVVSVLVNRSALFATALLAVIVYSTTVVLYFVNHFNEGYMSEMYAEVGLYSGLMVASAFLLWAVRHKHEQ